MSELTITSVQSRQDERDFLRLPWRIYADDPHWVPPLLDSQAALAGFRSHPFYADADARAFLARRDEQPCGRLVAIQHHAHARRHDESCGFFGFFESTTDQQVARGLFDAAQQWFTAKGVTLIRGPFQPSINYESGLLIDRFDSAPTFGTAYNPAYYADLIEGSGFRKAHDLYSFIADLSMLEQVGSRFVRTIEEIQRRLKPQIRCLDRKNYHRDMRLLCRIYNETLLGIWGFNPLTTAEIEDWIQSIRPFVDPELIVFAEVDGKVVAAIQCLPDYHPILRQLNGRLTPWGRVRLALGRHKLTRTRIVSAHVRPGYQLMGLPLLMLIHVLKNAKRGATREAEFSWVYEDHQLSRRSIEHVGAQRFKTYRIYERP